MKSLVQYIPFAKLSSNILGICFSNFFGTWKGVIMKKTSSNFFYANTLFSRSRPVILVLKFTSTLKILVHPDSLLSMQRKKIHCNVGDLLLKVPTKTHLSTSKIFHHRFSNFSVSPAPVIQLKFFQLYVSKNSSHIFLKVYLLNLLDFAKNLFQHLQCMEEGLTPRTDSQMAFQNSC